MTTYSLAGSFGWAGGGKASAVVDLWATSRFSGFPAMNEAPPSGTPDAGPVETSSEFGNPGGYFISGITVLQDYYIRIQYGGQTYWGERSAGSLSGLGGGSGDVLSVFGRTGTVTAQTGDYTASEVGADPTGSAAAAQANAETYAAAQAATAQSNAEFYAAAQAATAQSNAETYAATQATNAEAAAKAASLALTGGTMSGAITMGSHPITGITDLSMAGLSGATAATRYVGGTTSGHPSSGTFAVGDYVIAQNGVMWICTTAGTPGSWTTWGSASVLLGSGSPIFGTYTAGQALLYQGGSAGSTATVGNFSFGFPANFPNSLISLIFTAIDLGNSNVVMVNNAVCTLSIAAGQYYQNGSPLTGAMSVNYLAVGS